MNPLVSIILPCYNVSDFIDECVKSIENQTFRNFEAIFVDDGSTDKTLSILKKYEENPNFKIYTKKNEGSGFARNYGLEKAKGELIYFMDPDDTIDPELLAINVKEFQKKENLEMTLFGYKQIDRVKKKQRIFEPDQEYYVNSNNDIKNQYENIASEANVFTVWNKVYLKKFLVQNNLKFTNMPVAQDAEFNLRVFSKLNHLKVLPIAPYNYLFKREGSARTKYSKNKFPCEKRILFNMEELFSLWGKKEDYQYILNNYMVDMIYEEIKNLKKVKPFDMTSLKEDKIYEKVKKLKPKNLGNRNKIIKLFLIKNEMYGLIGYIG